MHCTNYTQTTYLNTLALGNLTITRLIVSIIAATVVTFALFAAMHALIDQENQRPSVNEPFIAVSSILEIPKEQTIIRPKPKLLPKVEHQAITPIELALEPSNQMNFTSAIHIPDIGVEKMHFNMGIVDRQPSPIVRVDPKYPLIALANGIEGFVTLTFGVSTSGEVVDIKIINSQPRNTFDRAAKQALRKWRYQPKMVHGSPVGMDGLQVQLDFSLANK